MNSNIFLLVKEIINQWDPVQLLAIHCPEDEYHSEIREICKYIETNINQELNDIELSDHIHRIFKEYLGIEYQETEDKSLEISRMIIKVLKRN
jgi:hypothetical protein